MQPIQLAAALIAFIGVIRSISLYRSRKLSNLWFAFWIIIWGAIGIVAFIPAVSIWLSAPFGIQRGVDFLLYVSIIVLFYIIFKLFMKIESLEHSLTLLVRETALRKK